MISIAELSSLDNRRFRVLRLEFGKVIHPFIVSEVFTNSPIRSIGQLGMK